MLLSGGVDSTVCAALLHKALKEDQVIAVHVDNGFMRKNESAKVEESLKALGLKVRGVLRKSGLVRVVEFCESIRVSKDWQPLKSGADNI